MNYHQIIYTLHIIFGLAFILIAYYGVKRQIPSLVYTILLVLAIIVLAYHLFKLVKSNNSYGRGLYLFHVLVVATILGLVGYQKANTPEFIYYVMFFLGLAAIAYHGKQLFSGHFNHDHHNHGNNKKNKKIEVI